MKAKNPEQHNSDNHRFEERIKLADSVDLSLNSFESGTDKAWASLATLRASEIDAETCKPVSGPEALRDLKNLYQ